jgi:hypothetical protein
MLRFAIASLKYHRRLTLLYCFLLVILGMSLLLLNTLIASIPLYLKQIKVLFTESGYQETNRTVWQQLQTTAQQLQHFYSTIYTAQVLMISLLFILFFVFVQFDKKQELLAWKQSGSTWYSWLRLNWTETLPPLLCFVIVASGIALLLQNWVNTEGLQTHLDVLTSLDKLDPQQTLLSQIEPSDRSNQIVIRLPETNQALLESIHLSATQVLTLLFHALGKALATLFLITSLSSLMVTGSHSYWRYHQWKNTL